MGKYKGEEKIQRSINTSANTNYSKISIASNLYASIVFEK